MCFLLHYSKQSTCLKSDEDCPERVFRTISEFLCFLFSHPHPQFRFRTLRTRRELNSYHCRRIKRTATFGFLRLFKDSAGIYRRVGRRVSLLHFTPHLSSPLLTLLMDLPVLHLAYVSLLLVSDYSIDLGSMVNRIKITAEEEEDGEKKCGV